MIGFLSERELDEGKGERERGRDQSNIVIPSACLLALTRKVMILAGLLCT